MLLRFSRYITAFVFLLALAVIYQNIIGHWIRPPRIEAIALAPARVRSGDASLTDLFPEGSWQRGSCKQLQTSDGMLLFENWEQISDDQWKLWPITVVIGRGMSADKSQSPIVIEASEGADITFTQSLDVMSGGAPPIHRGRMIGSVHIYRAGEVDQSRALDLRTANVGIDNRKIWTSEAIKMTVGEARLVGRDLTIHLAGTARPSSGGAADLDHMELIYLDEFILPLENGGLWKGNPTSEKPAADPSHDLESTSAMISLRCGGRVEYDFAIDQLVLRDNVSLIHHVPGRMPDRFDCDVLDLQLNSPSDDSISRASALDWLLSVVATGSPAVAKLPSFDAELAAEKIDFDAQAGVITAIGSKGIRVRRGGISASLAQLRYRFDSARPKSIGEIDAMGAGIVMVDDPAVPLRRAQWRSGFSLRPVEPTSAEQLDSNVALSIEGAVQAWLTDGGEFEAESVVGLFQSIPKPAPQQGNTLVPDRFVIDGDVRVDTTAIAAETDRLNLFFVAEDDPKSVASNDQDKEAGSPLRQWVVQPREDQQMVAPVSRPRPVIRGDEISAQLRRNKNGLSAKDLTVAGSVEVRHLIQTGEQSLPALLTGDRLRLIDGGGDDILQLDSDGDSLARFEIGDGFFEGPQIQVRPGDNLVAMNSAGQFRIPTAALPTGLAGDQNSSVKWTKAPHCRWRGEMRFDGRTAILTDGVDIQASLMNGKEAWDLTMVGDRLQVDLLEGVQFRDVEAMRGASIQTIKLIQADNQPVLVQALRRAADGVLEAKHLLHAAQLTFAPGEGGTIVGAGPGWYRGWMIPQSKPGILSGQQNQTTDLNKPLNGIHLVYGDSMLADLTNKSLDFNRGVRVGIRGVDDWDQAFDVRAMDAISIGDSTLDCDRLRFRVDPGFVVSSSDGSSAGRPTPWEMAATIGVLFRSRNERGLHEGSASRASYSSSKDLFTVVGAPNRPAIFRQTLADGSRGPEVRVRTMSIRPKTMKIENARLESLNIATPPTTLKR